MNGSHLSFHPYLFYRLDYCLRNLGLVLLAILTVDPWPDLLKAGLATLQVLLAQMYSFAMNHYYDHMEWGEANHTGALLARGMSRRRVELLATLPLLGMLATLPWSDGWFVLLLLYEVLFHVYQAPGWRWKDRYLPSILLNAICLGTLLYLYPFVFLAGTLTPMGLLLSVLFFFHLSFQEIVHQIAHQGHDRIESLPAVHGHRVAVLAAIGCLLGSMALACLGLGWDPGRHLFLHAVFLFSAVRITALLAAPDDQGWFQRMRSSWHRWLMVPEGLAMVACLLYTRLA